MLDETPSANSTKTAVADRPKTPGRAKRSRQGGRCPPVGQAIPERELDYGERLSARLLAEAGGPVHWQDLRAALSQGEARERVLAAYREAGFRSEQFERNRNAREAMADALTYTEDWLELERPRAPERKMLAGVRRRLEWELWP